MLAKKLPSKHKLILDLFKNFQFSFLQHIPIKKKNINFIVFPICNILNTALYEIRYLATTLKIYNNINIFFSFPTIIKSDKK